MKAISYLIFFVSIYFCFGKNTDGIQRPCLRLDRECVGRVFARELRCAIRGDRPGPRDVSLIEVNYPHANSTIEFYDVTVNYLNEFDIGSFYINRRNNKLVLELIFKNIEVVSDYTRAIFHKKGREPVETEGSTSIVFRNFSATLTVYNVDGRSERNSSDYRVYAYINDLNPPVGYTQSIVPQDPESWQQWQLIIGQWQYSLREKALHQAPLYMSYVAPCQLDIDLYSV